jgi:hypothetical protein
VSFRPGPQTLPPGVEVVTAFEAVGLLADPVGTYGCGSHERACYSQIRLFGNAVAA